MAFIVKIDERAFKDLLNAVDYYNGRESKLGSKLYVSYKKTVKVLKRNPYFQIKYDNIRCLLIKPFPYMIHFSINESEKIITIFAVVHTSLNPDENYVI